ncbi:amino acid ABC transporter permease [Bifidobacterium myosotis]|uniref:Amino acid ABC transporter permease n=1 Tax=Bifidobacterium myosotis TaxID=1630166 RepID=A0A261FF98_9BIFI|nr:amino acid ABC transporter permease [Bifidobacterium myosotis]OZG57695.1 amino acid ABC transporter permease [Bifidobacterium myosotis]
MVLSAITDVALSPAYPASTTLASGASVLFTGDNFTRLLSGLGTSVTVAGLALLVGIPLGVVLGALRILKNPVLRAVLRLYLEFFRIVPTLVLLFLSYYILPRELGVQVDGVTVAVVAFGLWVSAEISDIVRGALISVSDHQVDAGKALGMNGLQLLWYVRIPQSINLMIPATINLAARVIMTTSLLLLISVIDVITVGQQIMEANRMTHPDAAFWVYGFIFFLYFIICWPLAMIAKALEKRAKERNNG